MSILRPITETDWMQKARMLALLMAMGHSAVAAVTMAFLSQ